jgi:hypothetical protein
MHLEVPTITVYNQFKKQKGSMSTLRGTAQVCLPDPEPDQH